MEGAVYPSEAGVGMEKRLPEANDLEEFMNFLQQQSALVQQIRGIEQSMLGVQQTTLQLEAHLKALRQDKALLVQKHAAEAERAKGMPFYSTISQSIHPLETVGTKHGRNWEDSEEKKRKQRRSNSSHDGSTDEEEEEEEDEEEDEDEEEEEDEGENEQPKFLVRKMLKGNQSSSLDEKKCKFMCERSGVKFPCTRDGMRKCFEHRCAHHCKGSAHEKCAYQRNKK